MKPNHGRRGDPIWLPEVLRAFGVTVKELPGWKNWGVGDFDDIQGVACHHTAGANTSAQFIARNPMLGNQLSSQIHLGRDGVATMCGAGIAWHFGEAEKPSFPAVLRGYVQRKSNGAWRSYTSANARMISIEAVNAGDGSQPWPQVQMDAYARICAAICWYLGLPVSRVLGHKEGTARKIDPNFDMGKFRAQVQKYVDHPPFTPPKPTPAPTLAPKKGPTVDYLKEIWQQLRGMKGDGWPQLGKNAKGENLSLVDGVAALRKDVAAVSAKIDALIGGKK